jgi:hypothetical protein
MKKEKKRFFCLAIIVALFCALIAMTASTFAYWDTLTKTDTPIVEIGEGTEVFVNVTLPNDRKLIPEGAIKKNNADGKEDVYYIDLVYNVNLSHTPANALDLVVKTTNVKIDGDDTNASLVVISCKTSTDDYEAIRVGGYTYDDILVDDEAVPIVIRVELLEPIDETQYLAVANKQITFDLIFSASQ